MKIQIKKDNNFMGARYTKDKLDNIIKPDFTEGRVSKIYNFQIIKNTTVYNKKNQIIERNIEIPIQEDFQYDYSLDQYIDESYFVKNEYLQKFYSFVSKIEANYRQSMKAKIIKDVTYKKTFVNRGPSYELELPIIEFQIEDTYKTKVIEYFCLINFKDDKNEIGALNEDSIDDDCNELLDIL